MDDSTEFEMIFFALDADGKNFLLETGRALVQRTERRARIEAGPKLSLVPPRLLKPVEESIDSTVKLVTPPVISKPESSQ